MVRRALATIGVGPMSEVLALSRLGFVDLAERHGYDYVEGDGASDGRPPAWGKVLLARRLLEDYDEVLWLDADAIVLKNEVDPASTVSPACYQAFARPRLPNGRRPLNTGVWLLRGKRAADFLTEVWARDQWVDHTWWEQRAVIDLLGFDVDGGVARASEWRDGVCWLTDEWNSVECMTGLRNARIRHYASRSTSFRVERMRIDLAIVNKMPRARFDDHVWRLRHPGRFNERIKQYRLVAVGRSAVAVMRRRWSGAG